MNPGKTREGYPLERTSTRRRWQGTGCCQEVRRSAAGVGSHGGRTRGPQIFRYGAAMRDKDPETDLLWRSAFAACEQAPPPVLLTQVVKHVATLTQGLQISAADYWWDHGQGAQPPAPTLVVRTAMSSSPTRRARRDKSPSASIAPGPLVFIPPSTIAYMLDLHGHGACRTCSHRPLARSKPDHRRKLRPVDRIKPFVLGANRHRAF